MHNTDWMREGACRDPEIDKNVFFPDQYDTRTMAIAKAICNTCIVVRDCLEYALEDRNVHGIFGATSDRQRNHIRRANHAE